jgi:hypothetical protein
MIALDVLFDSGERRLGGEYADANSRRTEHLQNSEGLTGKNCVE